MKQGIRAVLRPCKVPWMISPSMDGLTLEHTSTECRVIFGGGRLRSDDRTDSRRIELSFLDCFDAQVHSRNHEEDLDAEGFTLLENGPAGPAYLKWLPSEWRITGQCPRSGLWIAVESERRKLGTAHYIVGGRDVFFEVLARTFTWREWIWKGGDREQVPSIQPVSEHGRATDEDAAQPDAQL